jgi:hypothetical protein
MSTHQEAMSYLKRLLGIILLVDSAIWFNAWALFTFVPLGIANKVFGAAVFLLMGLSTLLLSLFSKIRKPSNPKDYRMAYYAKLACFSASGLLMALGVLTLFVGKV